MEEFFRTGKRPTLSDCYPNNGNEGKPKWSFQQDTWIPNLDNYPSPVNKENNVDNKSTDDKQVESSDINNNQNSFQNCPIGSFTIDVPANVRYLSDWNEFNFGRFPQRCIIDKQIPGCGMTEYCLNGPEFVILCSPRKLLLQNKKDQHGDDVFLVKNEMEKDINIDIDINRKSTKSNEKLIGLNDMGGQIEDKSRNEEIYNKIFREFTSYINYIDHRPRFFNPYKILVTYDSYHIIKDILIKMDIFNKFYTVVDEFQSILHDARFKSTTELRFLKDLELNNNNSKVLFVSATPILEEYIKQIESFKNLPFYTLDWYSNDPTRVIKPDLDINYMSSIGSKAREIIKSYLLGNYDSVVVNRGGQLVTIQSTEAVFYVNSVNTILNIISNNTLQPDQVNILCADTEENKNKIKSKLGDGFKLGYIPLKGKSNKMFTFCTRTVYLGADFYSKCAKSFIFSDSNSDCLSVDISEDLPQILGRQRDNDNPWKNSANFYYKTTADYKRMTKEDFDLLVENKLKTTKNLIAGYDNNSDISIKRDMAIKYKSAALSENYKKDYVSVDYDIIRVKDEKGNLKVIDKFPKPVINDLVMVNEIRAFRIQQIDYKDRFAVFSAIEKKFNVDTNISNDIGIRLSDFFSVYDSFSFMYDKLRYLCEFSKNPTVSQELIEAVLSQLSDSDEVKSYFIALGPDKLKSLGYSITRIKKELGIAIFDKNLLINSIYSVFKVGDKITLSELKEDLSKLYKGINYDKTPKAVDIEDYFEVKPLLLSIEENGVKKRAKGYKLINSYEDRIRLDMRMSK